MLTAMLSIRALYDTLGLLLFAAQIYSALYLAAGQVPFT